MYKAGEGRLVRKRYRNKRDVLKFPLSRLLKLHYGICVVCVVRVIVISVMVRVVMTVVGLERRVVWVVKTVVTVCLRVGDK